MGSKCFAKDNQTKLFRFVFVFVFLQWLSTTKINVQNCPNMWMKRQQEVEGGAGRWGGGGNKWRGGGGGGTYFGVHR